MITMLADAQTSGGLLFTCAPSAAAEAVTELTTSGHAAAVIGIATGGNPGVIDIG
jgi:selenide,water dikinase